ncbi:MAG: molybdenum cofactor biosynthesis protein MoaE [Armatimonadetes bacterium]|nr:molybdenum cofactor biosynthesis protein MoaE [Armatimonadota bacterium]
MFEVWDKPLEIQPLLDCVSHPGAGAVVTFHGVVRNNSRGREVDHLEYEAYRPMAERVLWQIGDEAREQWGVEIAILHRVGCLDIGEASVLIAVSAPHRHEAFEACEYAMDRIKEAVPIWKKEVTPTGDWWVEGASAINAVSE